MPKFQPIIEVSPNYVVVEGVRVPRPSCLAPSQWLAFWERVTAPPIAD